MSLRVSGKPNFSGGDTRQIILILPSTTSTTDRSVNKIKLQFLNSVVYFVHQKAEENGET